jgi:hypothetical protein
VTALGATDAVGSVVEVGATAEVPGVALPPVHPVRRRVDASTAASKAGVTDRVIPSSVGGAFE